MINFPQIVLISVWLSNSGTNKGELTFCIVIDVVTVISYIHLLQMLCKALRARCSNYSYQRNYYSHYYRFSYWQCLVLQSAMWFHAWKCVHF